jgi:AcrR family transcriptional regulator
VTSETAESIGLRERKKAQTYDAIIGAALELFERNGYDATTVEEIADAADVSPRTFFRYFDAKVETVMGHKDDRGGELGALIAERPADEGPIEAFRQVMREVFGPMITSDEITARQMRVMLGTPSLRAMAREHFHEHESELSEVFADRLGRPESDLRVHVCAAAVGSTMWTVIGRWVVEDRSADELVPMIDEAFGLLAEGLEQPAG